VKRGLPPYVYAKKGGGVYFQRRGWPSHRFEAAHGTPEFAREYARILSGTDATPEGKRSFNALVRSYVKSRDYTKLAPRTVKDYSAVLAWVQDKIGPLPVDKMQHHHVVRARDDNADTLRFANYIVQVLRILFQHSMGLGWRNDNPAKGVSLLISDRAPRMAWPPEAIAAYRANATGRARLVFELCLGTGQRIGDVLRMGWSDIEGDGIHVRQGKTGARLWLPFTPALRECLAATPRIGLTICAWGKHGKPSRYRGAADLVMAVRRKIGAEAYDMHGLRYTAAAELGAAGCSDELIMAVTGHKTSAMVAKYAGPARQKARAMEAQGKRE
jgi:integrase